MKYILFIIFFWMSIKTLSQGWEKYDTSFFLNTDYSVSKTSDGGWIAAGTSWLSGTEKFFILLSKFNKNAGLEWHRSFAKDSSTTAAQVIQLKKGGFAVLVHCADKYIRYPGGDYSVQYRPVLIKTDAEGRKLWSKSYPPAYINKICETPDGDILLAGSVIIYENGNKGFTSLLKVNSEGNPVWAKYFQNKTAGNPVDIIPVDDGGVLMLCRTDGTVLYKLRKDYTVEWCKSFPELHTPQKCLQTRDGGYIISGSSIVKISAEGNIRWQKRLLTHHNSSAVIRENDDKSVIYSQKLEYDYSTGINNASLLFSLDQAGNLLWKTVLGALQINEIIPEDDGYYLTGNKNGLYFAFTDRHGKTGCEPGRSDATLIEIQAPYKQFTEPVIERRFDVHDSLVSLNLHSSDYRGMLRDACCDYRLTASVSWPVCAGSKVLISGAGAPRLKWSNGIERDTFSVIAQDTILYFLEGKNSCKTMYDTIAATVMPSPYFRMEDTVKACRGQTVSLYANTNAGGLRWYAGGTDLGSANPLLIQASRSGYYVVSGNINHDRVLVCWNQDSVYLKLVDPAPEITIRNNILYSNFKTVEQWLLNGEKIPGAAADTLVPVEKGWYSFEVREGLCSRRSDEVFIDHPASPTGSIRVYPNPVRDHLNIETVEYRDLKIEMRNPFGIVVLHMEINELRSTVNLENLAGGFYILSIQDKNQVRLINKVIKKD